jgi:hypothetical protein
MKWSRGTGAERATTNQTRLTRRALTVGLRPTCWADTL